MTFSRPLTLWLALFTVTRDVERVARADIASTGLCVTDFGILEALLHSPSLRAGDLSSKVLITSGSMTTAIDRLESRGLVARTIDPSDARGRVVSLTATGRALIEPALARHDEALAGAFAPLDAEERGSLLRLLLKLRHATRTKGHSNDR